MPHPKLLTRADILRAARSFRWTRKMPKWTVVVEDRLLPARPLVLQAAGALPNDPTNSHQAVAILEDLGFDTRYRDTEGKTTALEAAPSQQSPNVFESLFDLAREITRDIPEEEWAKVPKDLSINLDHYLYGHRKKEE
jgi:hypothetical protein